MVEAQEPDAASEADALARLQERLDRASEAAERLIADAASQAAAQAADAVRAAQAARKPPPAGWQQPESEPAQQRGGGEIELLLDAIGALRDRIPPELQRRLGEALREVLLALRALIDWYLERSERRRSAPDEPQDIPIV